MIIYDHCIPVQDCATLIGKRAKKYDKCKGFSFVHPIDLSKSLKNSHVNKG